tara:strand:+ start:22390 stop:23232 length:843 start_codon:yes stop_codon:yes gene_type:complete
MNRIFLFLLVILSLNAVAQEMNVMTYNIRYNNPEDGENVWSNRKEFVCQLIQFHEPDVFGLQEAMVDQVHDIAETLPQYSWVGVGRIDGKEEGEYSPVFFNAEKYKLLGSGNFWLANDCTKPSFGWDAACIRVCTWTLLSENHSKQKFMVFNTHFDHVGDVAREESAKLVIEKIKEINTKNLPIILTGDFNLFDDSAPIKTIKTELLDSKEISAQKPYGPEGTFNGFDFTNPLERRIDYIFVNDQVEVKKYAVLSDSKNLHYPSDHLPVFTEIRLKGDHY